MEKNTTKKPSLFSSFLHEIDNEKLGCDIPCYETSIRETCNSDEENATINLDNNLNDSNDKCEVMVKYTHTYYESHKGSYLLFCLSA
jgi:hypothetical protein